MKRDALARFLAPMSPEAFLATYWLQRSVHIPGTAAKVGDLFSVDAFHAAVTAAARRPDAGPAGFDVRAGAMRKIDASAIGTELAAGQTICVSGIDLGNPALAQLARDLKRELAFPGRVGVHAYLSPRGSGFSFTHFDARVATTLQIAGRKKWKYALTTSLPWPHHNVRIAPDGSLDWHTPPSPWEQRANLPGTLDMIEVVLEPGHVLCLPPGTFHAAEAVDDISLSINVNFNYSGFFELIFPYLRETLAASSSWREPPPGALDPAIAVEAFPATQAEFFAARIAELHEAVDSLAEAGPMLWHQAMHALAPRPVSSVVVIEPTDRIDVASVSYLPASATNGFLVTARGPIAITAPAVAFAKELVQHQHFVAEEALAWSGGEPYRWVELHSMLTTLVARGVLWKAT
ncbi:MAG: JmjC domain-containing protein [Kofleriaceae bacterium]